MLEQRGHSKIFHQLITFSPLSDTLFQSRKYSLILTTISNAYQLEEKMEYFYGISLETLL